MSELLESLIKIKDIVNNISLLMAKGMKLSAKYKALIIEFDSILKLQTQRNL